MQSLKTLHGLDEDTATGVIAAVALSSFESEKVAVDDKNRGYSGRVKPVIDEVRQALKLAPGDETPSARGAIASFLSNVLVDATLRGRSMDDILAGVGQAGQLPPSAYKVVWDEGRTRELKSLGVRKSTVEKAISDPDEVQHLIESSEYESDDVVFSLFLKMMPGNKNIGPHWLLVQTVRKGITQSPVHAWWIHPDMVDLSKVSSPKDMLKAFVEVFGKPFFLFGKKYNRFLDEEKFSKNVGEDANFELGVENKVGVVEEKFQMTWSIRTRPEWNYFIVGIVYIIDIRKYRMALKNIGAI